MLFYRAKREAYDYFNKNGMVEGELITQKERDSKFRYLKDDVFEAVDIPKNKTFWCFGARFEIKDA